jgi:prevent-host-death family protein
MSIDHRVAVTDAQNELPKIIRRLDQRDETITITRNGTPRAVLMSLEHYQSMLETMAVMMDGAVMQQIQESLAELQRKGELLDLEEV